MKKIKIIKSIFLPGVTPKSTNNLFVWFAAHGNPNKPANRATKSNPYKKWRRKLIELMPKDFIERGEKDIHLYIEVGIFKEFDLDNTLKGIIDALQIKYDFNDNEISYLTCKKKTIGTFERMIPEEHYIKICLLEKFEIAATQDLITKTLDISDEEITSLDKERNYDRYSNGLNEDGTKIFRYD